jgi:hypothetical protein
MLLATPASEPQPRVAILADLTALTFVQWTE